MVSRDESKYMERSNRSLCPSLSLEGQNGQSLHKLELVQLPKNVLCVLVISRVMKQIKNKLLQDFDEIPSFLCSLWPWSCTAVRLQCDAKSKRCYFMFYVKIYLYCQLNGCVGLRYKRAIRCVHPLSPGSVKLTVSSMPLHAVSFGWNDQQGCTNIMHAAHNISLLMLSFIKVASQNQEEQAAALLSFTPPHS